MSNGKKYNSFWLEKEADKPAPEGKFAVPSSVGIQKQSFRTNDGEINIYSDSSDSDNEQSRDSERAEVKGLSIGIKPPYISKDYGFSDKEAGKSKTVSITIIRQISVTHSRPLISKSAPSGRTNALYEDDDNEELPQRDWANSFMGGSLKAILRSDDEADGIKTEEEIEIGRPVPRSSGGSSRRR